jgi:hypothetical protein
MGEPTYYFVFENTQTGEIGITPLDRITERLVKENRGRLLTLEEAQEIKAQLERKRNDDSFLAESKNNWPELSLDSFAKFSRIAARPVGAGWLHRKRSGAFGENERNCPAAIKRGPDIRDRQSDPVKQRHQPLAAQRLPPSVQTALALWAPDGGFMCFPSPIGAFRREQRWRQL